MFYVFIVKNAYFNIFLFSQHFFILEKTSWVPQMVDLYLYWLHLSICNTGRFFALTELQY